jgi:hypothetical protein
VQERPKVPNPVTVADTDPLDEHGVEVIHAGTTEHHLNVSDVREGPMRRSY